MTEIDWLQNEVNIISKEVKKANKEKTAIGTAKAILTAYAEHMERIADRLFDLVNKEEEQ